MTDQTPPADESPHGPDSTGPGDRADGRVDPFRLHLPDGRVWYGARYPDGFVCIHHPDEINICTIARTLDDAVGNHWPGARAEWPVRLVEWAAAQVTPPADPKDPT